MNIIREGRLLTVEPFRFRDAQSGAGSPGRAVRGAQPGARIPGRAAVRERGVNVTSGSMDQESVDQRGSAWIKGAWIKGA